MSTDLDYSGFTFNLQDLLDAKNAVQKTQAKPSQKQKIYGSRNAIKRLKKARREE